MTDIREFRTRAFLNGAKTALARDGFVTDEHPFAPYRDVVSKKVNEIQKYLHDNGATYDLAAGKLDSLAVGPVFFIYDRNRLSAAEANKQVSRWIGNAVDQAEV